MYCTSLSVLGSSLKLLLSCGVCLSLKVGLPTLNLLNDVGINHTNTGIRTAFWYQSSQKASVYPLYFICSVGIHH